MREPVSPLVSASLSLRVLRRLLDDETLIASQISYLVEAIYDPLCAGTPGKTQGAPAAHEEDADVNHIRDVLHSPSVLLQIRKARGERVLLAAQDNTSAVPLAHADSAPSAPAAPLAAVAQVLTAEQLWSLFANIGALYHAQMTVVAKLDRAVTRVTHLLDRLQSAAEAREYDEGLPDGALSLEYSPLPSARQDTTAHHRGTGPCVVSPDATAVEEPSTCSLPQQQQQQKCAARAGGDQPFVSPASKAHDQTAVSDSGGYHELAAILSDFFTGEWMSHYAAEHMMYTAQFTTKIAPKILELNRLWRWGASEAMSVNSTTASAAVSGAAVLRALGQASSRKALIEHAKFIDFLYRSLGPTGVPEDVRVAYCLMPEDCDVVRGRRLRAESADVDMFSTASGPTRRGTAAMPSGRPMALTGAPAAKPGDLPTMSAIWPGFETFLTLLATPLSSLRRHHHACRCILEAGALLREGRQHLTTHYVGELASHMMEESTLVLNELGEMDVAHVVHLIDDVSTDDPHLRGVLQRLKGGHSSHSGSSSRLLIHFGRLKKRYGRGGRHERLILLFSDCFCYVEESRSGRLRPRGGASLDAVRVLEVPEGYGEEDVETAVELVLQPATKRLIFYADTPEQKWQWVEAIRFASRQYRRWQSSSRKPASPSAREAVVAPGVHPLPVRPNTFSHRSRLGRQQRSDQHWQEFLEMQRFLTVPTTAADTGTARRSSTAGVPGSASSRAGSPAMPVHLGAQSCASLSDGTTLPQVASLGNSIAFGTAGTGNPLVRSHTQIEYDITPWSHQSSAQRRLRSQEASATIMVPPGVSSQQSLADSAAGEVHSYPVSPAHGAQPVAGKPPTAASASGTPLRLPLMDRVDPAPSALPNALPPMSPCSSTRRQSGMPCASTGGPSGPNRALQFDTASHGAEEGAHGGENGIDKDRSDEQGAFATTPNPETESEGSPQTGGSPLPIPDEEADKDHPLSQIVPRLSDAEYDKDLESLMKEHLVVGADPAAEVHSGCTSGSHSTLIEESTPVTAAAPHGWEGEDEQRDGAKTRSTPEEHEGPTPFRFDPARPSSTVSEGHSSFRADDHDDGEEEDSVIAVTAFSRRAGQQPLAALSPRSDLLSTTSGLDSFPSTEPNRSAKATHADPNMALNLDTEEL